MTTSESAAKKDIQKLQKAIVEGLEDVKGQDIVEPDYEDLSDIIRIDESRIPRNYFFDRDGD